MLDRPSGVDRRRSFALLTWALFFSLLLAGEIACRLLVPPHHKFQWPYEKRARNTIFRFDPELGWFPKEGHSDWFEGSVRLFVTSNSDGFRDVEHDLEADGRPRVVVLGDSFVWGYDVETEDRFLNLLQERLPEIEFFNCGVGGYGTGQELLLYKLKARKYNPDLVLLVFSGNDRFSNKRPITHGGYAIPHFRLKGGELELTNSPVPRLMPFFEESERKGYFFRSHLWDSLRYAVFKAKLRFEKETTEALVVAILEETEAEGVELLVAIRSDDEGVEKTCREKGIESVLIDEYLRRHADADLPVEFPSQGNHWTPHGHELVADLLEPVIRRRLGVTFGSPETSVEPAETRKEK